MATKEQSVTLLRKNKQAQVQALTDIGFKGLDEGMRASLFPMYVKWASGLLDLTIAANRRSDNKKFFFTLGEWQSLSATEQGLFLLRGVRVRAYGQSFVIAPDNISDQAWGPQGMYTPSANVWLYGGNGILCWWDAWNETHKNIDFFGDGKCPASEAAIAYKAFTIADGLEDDSEWCLPSPAHMIIIFRLKAQIDEIFSTVWSSVAAIRPANYWTCLAAYGGGQNAYVYNMAQGAVLSQTRSNSLTVRPISLI